MAIKMVQILGQFLKNFPGSLPREEKIAIATECYSLALRTLGSMYARLRDDASELVADLIREIERAEPRLTHLQVKAVAEDSIVSLAETLGVMIIKFLSQSVGSTELRRVYDEIARELPIPSVGLINASITMDLESNFPTSTIVTTSRELAKNAFASSILAQIVLMRFDLFPVSVQAKQQVCSALGIRYTSKIGAGSQVR